MVNQMRPPSTTWVTLVSLTAVIYTANAIWAVNAHLRRTVQGPAHFPTGRPRSVPPMSRALMRLDPWLSRQRMPLQAPPVEPDSRVSMSASERPRR
jgi:hypothetical protein